MKAARGTYSVNENEANPKPEGISRQGQEKAFWFWGDLRHAEAEAEPERAAAQAKVEQVGGHRPGDRTDGR